MRRTRRAALDCNQIRGTENNTASTAVPPRNRANGAPWLVRAPRYLPTGELLRETAARGVSKLEATPLVYTNIRGEEAVDGAVVVGGDAALVGTEDKDRELEPFDPSMIRATTQWEVLQQRIDKKLWGRHDSNTWEKIQVGGAVLLAVAVVAVAAFLLLATGE